MKKIILLAMIMLMPLITACTKEITVYNAYRNLPKITEEDYETIDYVNSNSDIGVEFMKKLREDIDVEPFAMEVRGYCEQSTEGTVEGEAHYIPELKGKYLSRVKIFGNDKESNILGVRKGDRYEDAVKKLEEHGFEFYMDDTTYKEVLCRKGRVAVGFYYDPYKDTDKKDFEINQVKVEFMYKAPSDSKIGVDH